MRRAPGRGMQRAPRGAAPWPGMAPASSHTLSKQLSLLTSHCNASGKLAELSITQVGPPPTHEGAHCHSHVHPNPVGTIPSLPLGPEQPPDQPQHILEQSHIKPYTPFLSVCVLSLMCHTKEEKTHHYEFIC